MTWAPDDWANSWLGGIRKFSRSSTSPMEIVHAVLVIVKAAEYTGVRWYTDPTRASWYNDLMLEWYGPTHDAYRMAFAPEAVVTAS